MSDAEASAPLIHKSSVDTDADSVPEAYPAERLAPDMVPEELTHLSAENNAALKTVSSPQKRGQSGTTSPTGEEQKPAVSEHRSPNRHGTLSAPSRKLRDIRTAIPRNGSARPWTLEPLITPAAPDTAETDTTGNSVAPLSLTFPVRDTESVAAQTAREGTSGNGVPPLPEWAQKLLEKPEAPGTAISRTPEVRQIEWTAPNAITPTLSRPTSITWLEREAPQQREPPPPSMSEAEIRRTADKIYRIIEERLQRELRRSGK